MGQLFSSATGGKVILLTGAAGGIGTAAALAFAAAGAQLCLVDLSESRLHAIRARLERPSAHMVIAQDLVDIEAHAQLVDQIVDHFGHLDALVHFAAIIKRQYGFDAVTEADWDSQIDTNLKATYFLNMAVARVLKAQRSGTVINLASQAWWTGGLSGSLVYAISKGGVVTLTRGLARLLAPFGVTVNAVAPGLVDTEMMSATPRNELAKLVAQVPMGRMASPDEIASAVLFLASDSSRYLTGITLNVSGGQLIY
jgi:NAD(P)-dependent dehydrogenase (short-subunit alcohol dehydrogenase family)